MNNNNGTLADIKRDIDIYKANIGERNLFRSENNNGHYCCYLCDEVIRDMDFRFIAIGHFEWENGIDSLVCGIKCQRVCEELKGRCDRCHIVIDIGYYRDFPLLMRCDNCIAFQQDLN